MLEWPRDTRTATGTIDGPDGVLEVTVDLPKDPPRGFVVVCHPHPLEGGTKDNKVVYMSARAATQAGLAAVRFNFRGVGESGGSYAEGIGEVDDARAVRAWAADTSGLPDHGLVGFSFGSAVALRLAAADGAASLITIGFPASYFGGDPLPRPDCPWLAIFGDADDVIDVEDSITALRKLDAAIEIEIMEGAEHFLHGRLGELRKIVLGYWQDNEDAG